MKTLVQIWTPNEVNHLTSEELYQKQKGHFGCINENWLSL